MPALLAHPKSSTTTPRLDRNGSEQPPPCDNYWMGWASILLPLLWGLLLTIETAEGTLLIESEVSGVEVEVLEEAEQVARLTIEEGENHTKLAIGKYRIHIKGPASQLRMTPEEIELVRGEEVVVRIEHRDNEARTSKDDIQPLFQGKPRSAWLRRFQAEVDPTAKIEAARALVELSQGWSPDKRIAEIIRLGAELSQAAHADSPQRVALTASLYGGGKSAATWSNLTYPDVSKKLSAMDQLLEKRLITNTDPFFLAKQLVEVVNQAMPKEAAFALTLVEDSTIVRHLQGDQSAVAYVVENLARNDDEQLRLACLFVRSAYLKPGEANEAVRNAIEDLGSRLIAGEVEVTHPRLNSTWLHYAPRLDVDGVLHARMQLKQIVDSAKAHRIWYDGEFPYSKVILDRRAQWAAELPEEFLPLATQWLTEHTASESVSSYRAVMRTVTGMLRVQRTSDSKQNNQTAQAYEELLRQHYDRLDQYDDQELQHLTEPLLANFVLCQGKLPAEIPQLQLTGQLQQQMEALLGFVRLEYSSKKYYREKQQIRGLMQSLPVSTSMVILTASQLPEHQDPLEMIDDASTANQSNTSRNDRRPPIEPLLLLALLEKHTGESKTQDERTAAILDERSPSRRLMRHVNDILGAEQSLLLRQFTMQLLESMHAKSQSEALSKRIEEIAAWK